VSIGPTAAQPIAAILWPLIIPEGGEVVFHAIPQGFTFKGTAQPYEFKAANRPYTFRMKAAWN